MRSESAELKDFYLVLSCLQPHSRTVKTLLRADVPVPSEQSIVDPNVSFCGLAHIQIGIPDFLQLEASSFENWPFRDRVHFLRVEDAGLVEQYSECLPFWGK